MSVLYEIYEELSKKSSLKDETGLVAALENLNKAAQLLEDNNEEELSIIITSVMKNICEKIGG